MERHFVDHMEAFGNGYEHPQDVVGRFLPEGEVKAPHECVPGICQVDDLPVDDVLAPDIRALAHDN